MLFSGVIHPVNVVERTLLLALKSTIFLYT